MAMNVPVPTVATPNPALLAVAAALFPAHSPTANPDRKQRIDMKTPRHIIPPFRALVIGAVLGSSGAFGDTVEKKARETIIPKLELEDATVRFTLNVFTTATGIKVFYVPPKDDKATLTLSLANVPASEALKYITQLANLKFTYEEDGVHVTPK